MLTRHCQHCGGSLEGKRSDARFCSASCRVNAHRQEVGRIEDVQSGYVIDKPTREMLIEENLLNPQDEGNPSRVREAFNLFVREYSKKYA